MKVQYIFSPTLDFSIFGSLTECDPELCPTFRLNKFLQYLTEAGFRVSRTHFDPTGVRTDATLVQFKEVLTKYSVPTYSSTPESSAVSSDVTRRQTL